MNNIFDSISVFLIRTSEIRASARFLYPDSFKLVVTFESFSLIFNLKKESEISLQYWFNNANIQ